MSFRKTLLITPVILLASAGGAFAGGGQHQTCDGTLTKDEDGWLLKPDPTMTSPWCDAYIPEALLGKVTKVCSLGDHCHIAGEFRGHGIFGWVKISTTTFLGNGHPAAQTLSKCSGILKHNGNDLVLSVKGEESICVVNASDKDKALSHCSLGHSCTLSGILSDCKDSGECVTISNIR